MAATTGANVGPHESATTARPDEYVLEIAKVELVAYELSSEVDPQGTVRTLNPRSKEEGDQRRTRRWTSGLECTDRTREKIPREASYPLAARGTAMKSQEHQVRRWLGEADEASVRTPTHQVVEIQIGRVCLGCRIGKAIPPRRVTPLTCRTPHEPVVVEAVHRFSYKRISERPVARARVLELDFARERVHQACAGLERGRTGRVKDVREERGRGAFGLEEAG